MIDKNKHIKLIISGGGTGGHIFPALAIADEFKRRYPNAEILFVGAKNRMEMQKVPAAGYPIESLKITGINRKKILKNITFPFKLLSSLWKANKIINQFKPDFVIGTGGFASGPVLFVAQRKGIPVFIQEQNSYPGITNKIVGKKAIKIYTAYDNLETYFDRNKINKTGNPIRQDLQQINIDKKQALKAFNLKHGLKTILILGGSLGAEPINKAIEKLIQKIKNKSYQLIWQTGKNNFKSYEKYNNEQVKVLDFISNMPVAYTAADLIVSRAGAGTISELSVVGKPVILVPSPYVAEDHQTKNAQYLANKKAAVLLKENELNQLFDLFQKIFESEKISLEMSRNIKNNALPDATKKIVDDIISILKKMNKW